MGREMENLEYARVSEELQPVLGKRLENIYGYGKGRFRLKIGAVELACVLGQRLHQTKYIPRESRAPGGFAEFLRSKLRGGRISAIRQRNSDRIVEMRVEREGEEYSLVFEMFGDGNLILLEGEGRIIAADSFRRWKGRDILRSAKYAAPPAPALPPCPSLSEMKGIAQKKFAIAVFAKIPLGITYMREALHRAGVGEKAEFSGLNDGEVKKVLEKIGEIRSENSPCLYFSEGRAVQFSCARLTHLEREGIERKALDIFCEAADGYYAECEKEEEEKKRKGELEKVRERIRLQEEHIKKLEEECEKNMQAGRGIYKNFEEAEEEIRKTRKRGERKVFLEV